MARIEAAAPAKVNLTLHVTGQRPDGYHLLDSLVVFADSGDRITVAPAPETRFSVTGPRAEGVPTDASNLVLKAATLMACAPSEITLEKRLPAASGIGGGSADAAATLRALCQLYHLPLPSAEEALRLGADVPVCLQGRAIRMSGIGERLDPVPALPPLPAVLVNPGVEVSTPEVFQKLTRRDNPPMRDIPAGLTGPNELAAWLAAQRNDLEAPARSLAPEISHTLAALAATQACLLARMSGSGATCFGLYPDAESAEFAAESLRAAQPDWWVLPTVLT
ncbi:4-(cytidine 5'-diphospho)-2-C-methyl-D-erythritol kinase [Tropicimonas sp. TH_r6]|uniref:4-(cytidine 5'-diphospho)-2-C-methyl-D-erythritol kinase n=1 Tax=Tropicimonas sp. TH_r6 TaxID=3082085 RepID=UPI002952B756|nr:4-(cytidine 5'-diphospho)-2-C-methyl-D-erythritol kinase [Tropicimonas sp. TH_r6]MDV7145172.1 4-(cytidine 5'-diphospho)-2-C-methyl-D-erythritol kinase [Tropicimonas sp. TH_r6]